MSQAQQDDCDKRGRRGKRGHRGHTGDPGPSGGGGLLKFSGSPLSGVNFVSYLADNGFTVASPVLFTPQDYPAAVVRTLRNLAARVALVVPAPNGSLLVELLQNGIAVPGFALTFLAPGVDTILTIVAGPAPFVVGDRFDLRITTNNLGEQGVNVSATVGIE